MSEVKEEPVRPVTLLVKGNLSSDTNKMNTFLTNFTVNWDKSVKTETLKDA